MVYSKFVNSNSQSLRIQDFFSYREKSLLVIISRVGVDLLRNKTIRTVVL